MSINCKAHIKHYQVTSKECLDKEIKLSIIITEKESKLQEILKELAVIKADDIILLQIDKKTH